MKNRVAWGLVVVLATSMLGGGSGFVAYGRQTGAFTVHWQPIPFWRYWWVGQRPLVVKACGPQGSIGTLVGQRYSLGLVEVQVPYHGRELVLYDTFPKTSTRSGTER